VQNHGEHAVRTAAHPALFAGAEQHRTRTIAEKHGHFAPALGKLETGRVDLGADDEHVSVDSGPDPRVGNRQSIEKPRALVSHVEARHRSDAELVLQQYARAGEKVVGAQCGENDRVDVALGLARLFERHPRGRNGEIARADAAVLDVPPLLDTRPLLNPFVARRKELGEVLVGDDLGRNEVTRAGNRGVRHGEPPLLRKS
jgi:hypothetical protein